MTQTQPSSQPTAEETAEPGGQRPSGRISAGRLAGRAVVWAWVLSALYHVVLFTVMYMLPWLSGIVGDASAAPTPLTDIVGLEDHPTVTLSPSPRLQTDVSQIPPDPLQFKPQQFQPMETPAPIKASGPKILGIGTGGGEFDKYGFRVSSGSGGPNFFGLGTQARGARRIVYVVDRSGSMMMTLGGVIRELKESIGGLRRTQKFHVIFFNAGQPLENRPRRLVSAIQAHKRDAFRFFDEITAAGSTDPRPAMRRAFTVDPDLIYFLTDGEFDAGLLDTLDRMNRNRRVRIFTLAYVNRKGAALLERIAREHNGQYRYVSEDEVFDN